MKIVIERHTGLEEQCIIEIQHQAKSPGEYKQPDVLELRDLCRQAWQIIDDRVAHNNVKIEAAKEMVATITDKHHKFLFTQFLQQFLGISSEAIPLIARSKERTRHLLAAEEEEPPVVEEVAHGHAD